MRCLMEARLEGRRPISVTHQAATIGQAVDGAADKLGRKMDSTIGKLRDQRSRTVEPDSLEADPSDQP